MAAVRLRNLSTMRINPLFIGAAAILFTLGTGAPLWAQVSVPVTACSCDSVFPRGADPTPLPPPTLPKSGTVKVDVPQSAATKLEAYIYTNGTMLAPRGWNCLDLVFGGDGEAVSINPDSSSYGISEQFMGTDGYHQEAEIVSWWADTYFPKIMRQLSPNIVIQLVNGHNWTQDGAYAFPTYKTDQIKYLSDMELVYTTPAHRLGFGSQFFPRTPENNPQPTAQNFPISGFISLSARLMGDNRGLCQIVFYGIALPPDLSELDLDILRDAKSRPEAKPSTSC